MQLKIVPMSTSTAQSVRETMKTPGYGFPAHREAAAGRAPCRHCLRLIRPQAEELILFTYDAFEGLGVPPLPGPVYVHAEHCEAYAGDGHIPEEYRGQPLTLEAFGDGRQRLAERSVRGGEEETARELLGLAGVRYLHARSSTAGCYLFRVEKQGDPA